ncbi:MAG: hypothetical protein AAB583_04340, partial [Patescibacteria group bacterium]
NFWSDLLDPAYWLTGHRHYTKDQLTNMLQDANFKIEKIIQTGSFFSSFYALCFYFFKHILGMKMPHISWVEKKMEKNISTPGYIQIAIRANKVNI